MITVMTYDGKELHFLPSTRCLLSSKSAQPSTYPPPVSSAVNRPPGIKDVPTIYHHPDSGDPTMSLAEALGHKWHHVYLDCGRSIARGQSVWTRCQIGAEQNPA
jgi:hypothetical protein